MMQKQLLSVMILCFRIKNKAENYECTFIVIANIVVKKSLSVKFLW